MIPRLFVPHRAVLRALAWLALWPLAWAATGDPVVTVAFGAGTLVAATAFWSFRKRKDVSLDADAAAAPAFAAWMSASAVLVAVVAQREHRHGLFVFVPPFVAIVGAMLAGSALITRMRLRRWIDRVYRGDVTHLRVRATSEAVGAPLLSKVIGETNAAIVEGTTHDAGPYRAGEGRVVARVPADGSVLRRHQTSLAFLSTVAAVTCVASALFASPRFVSRVHRDDLASTPAKLPPLPASCHDKRITLHFAALAPLRVVDIEEIASRYAATGIGNVVMDDPIPFDDYFLDRDRMQLIGEEIARAVRKRHHPNADELVIVVTDRDLFLRDVDWRFAFATRERGIAVVSIARMDPNFPLLDPHTYEPKRPDCSANVRARAFRMITRQVLLGLCSAETLEDPRSARRRTVMGLSDLDAIDEATY